MTFLNYTLSRPCIYITIYYRYMLATPHMNITSYILSAGSEICTPYLNLKIKRFLT